MIDPKTTPEFEELKRVARGCITRYHAYHIRRLRGNARKLFERELPRRVKPLLYVYRVLLTGIHLMRTGEVEANLVKLNEQFRLSYLPELIERKLSGPPEGQVAWSGLLVPHGRVRATARRA